MNAGYGHVLLQATIVLHNETIFKYFMTVPINIGNVVNW